MKSKNLILTTAFITLLNLFSQGQTPTVGTSVQCDFDGDGKKEFATAVKTKQGEGNPVDGGTADEYSITFSNDKFKPIAIGCCDARIINEGDLNEDGKDDISIYQAPMNGTVYSITTYSFINGAWKVIIETFLVMTGGDYYDDAKLQKQIFKENGVVYRFDVDVNDKNMKLVKKKVILK